MPADPSPTGSVRSIASSRSGTLSRPPPPPKPSHLSSAFTGTCNSIALRHYIQEHTTGGGGSGTISKAHLGHGYDTSTVDHFVDAFDSASDDDDDKHDAAARLTVRGRTYTAPSVSRIFDQSTDDNDTFDTARLVRNEPISITGAGPSRVGNLRNLFEAAAPAPSTFVPLSRQNTGVKPNHTGTKPKISSHVRMLQAQITGDRFNGMAGAFHVADARSSIILETAANHEQEATEWSQDDFDIYRTATQDLLGDALKMDAVVMPPLSDTIRLAQPKYSSSSQAHATISRSTSLNSDTSAQHDRTESSATIRPSYASKAPASPSEPQVSSPSDPSEVIPSTIRVRPARQVSGSAKQGHLSSIFAASPQSSHRGDDHVGSSISPSPSGVSVASNSSSQQDSEAERSREPSMLLADDHDISFSQISQHLRANDGSCFDLDWGNNSSPSKAASVRRALLSSTAAQTPLEDGDEATIDANPRRKQGKNPELGEALLQADSARPPSIRVQDQPSSGTPTVQPEGQPEPEASALSARPSSKLQPPRPVSTRGPQSGFGRPARALYDFEGEVAFNELVIKAGQSFEILSDQLAGGWSLGLVWDADGNPTRGLIPQGWYCYIQDFTRSPPPSAGAAPPATPDLVTKNADALDATLPPSAFFAVRSADNVLEETAASVPQKIEQATSPSGPVDRGVTLESTEPVTSEVEIADKSTSPQSARTSAPVSADSSGPSCSRESSRPHTPNSADAALADADPAAVWQTSKDVHSKLVTEVESSTSSPAVNPTAMDGLPAPSDPDHPIDWSAMAESQVWAEEQRISSEHDGRPAVSSPAATPAVETTESSASAGSGWTGSIFGKKTFNRFASFVTSGAEDYVLSSSDAGEEERSRIMVRKVSGSKSTAGVAALAQVAEEPEGAADLPAGLETNSYEFTPAPQAQGGAVESDQSQHFVIAGAAGPKWKSQLPCFLVQVHHPEKRTRLNGMQEYTVYHVTSTYPIDAPDSVSGEQIDSAAQGTGTVPYDPLGGPYPPGAQVTVVRRFTQFEWLHLVLARHYSALLIPPLPEKQYSGRFASDFIETRRADLEMWISRLVRHPVLRYSEPIRFFLSCENENEWRTKAAVLLREGSSDGASMGGVFANTWHPDFNFDAGEAEVEAERMDAFLKVLEKTINGVGGHNAGKQGVLAAYKGHREGNVAISSTYRDLSYTLLRTLTGAGAGPADEGSTSAALLDEDAHRIHGPPMGNVGRRSETGATNEHGAWCWREDCQDCLNLTSALQNTAECLQSVADIYEHHARDALLRQHERYKEISRPHTMAQALLDTHRTTLAKHREATGEAHPWGDDAELDDAGPSNGARLPKETAEQLVARCETVVNVTMSEMDRVHDERVQDFHALGRSLLDGEIELYEGILEQLKAARLHYDEEYYERETDFHVLASRYQPELSRPKKPAAPLLMPSAAHGPPGGLGRAAGGVGLLLSQATGAGVTRPASIGVEDSDRSPLASPRRGELGMSRAGELDSGAGRTAGGGLLSTLLVPSVLRGRTAGDEDSKSTYLADTTNVQPSHADAALKALARKHAAPPAHDNSRSSSYFSAIWR
ncbi:related to Sorting nexin 9 [Moesziomyces antarcticus]|nr:related to Sorting nexin 9 [Moesziomyces antarcticus]